MHFFFFLWEGDMRLARSGRCVYFSSFSASGCVCGSFCSFLCERVFVLTKLPLSSQWVTCWPPQDCAYVRVAITRHGGSGPGVWAGFNTRHRWVAPWACCGGLPSAASSGCPDSKLIRLTVTQIPISPRSVPLRRCLSDSSPPVCLSLSPSLSLASPGPSVAVLQQKIQYAGVSGTSRLMASWERNVCSFFFFFFMLRRCVTPCIGQTERELCHWEGKMVDTKQREGKKFGKWKKRERGRSVKRTVVKIETGGGISW